jgi:hypothetical protein
MGGALLCPRRKIWEERTVPVPISRAYMRGFSTDQNTTPHIKRRENQRDTQLSVVLFSCPSFVAPAYFLLIVVCDSFVGGRLRPRCILFSIFFSSFHSPPGTMRQRPPTRSTPIASPLQRTPHHRHRLLVDCCVFRLNGGNLRPRHRPSLNFFSIPIRRPKRRENVLPTCSDPDASNLQFLPHRQHYHSVGCCVMTAKRRPPKAEAPPPLYFSMPLILPTQINEPTTSSASSTARDLRMEFGSGGAKIWGRRCSTHGERGRSRWG